tara:strand:+ start:6516 stop:7484 length:969 start_codon:yes stop_codon:yes gene_type:complete
MFFNFIIEDVGLCVHSLCGQTPSTVALVKGQSYIVPTGDCRKHADSSVYVQKFNDDLWHSLLKNLDTSAISLQCCGYLGCAEDAKIPPSCNGNRAYLSLGYIFKKRGFAGLVEIGDPYGNPQDDLHVIRMRNQVQNTVPLHGKIYTLLGISWNTEKSESCQELGHLVLSVYDVTKNSVCIIDCTKEPAPRNRAFKRNIGRYFSADNIEVKFPKTGYLQIENECEALATFIAYICTLVTPQTPPENITKELGKLNKTDALGMLTSCTGGIMNEVSGLVKPFLSKLATTYDSRVVVMHNILNSKKYQNSCVSEFVRKANFPLLT